MNRVGVNSKWMGRVPGRKIALGVFLIPLLVPVSLFSGISLPFAEFHINNLLPGRVYSCTEDILKSRFFIRNKTDNTLDFKLGAFAPAPEQLVSGYEAIPDGGWFTFADEYFTAGPQEEGGSECYLSIPDDPSLIGKNFQVQLVAQSVGSSDGGAIRLGLAGRALLHVSKENVPWQKEEMKTRRLGVRFGMEPHFVYAPEKVEMGKKISLSEMFGKTLMVKNDGQYPVKVSVRPVSINKNYVQPPGHYEALPDLSAIQLKTKVVKLAPGAEVEIKGSFLLPASETHLVQNPPWPATKGKQYYIVLEMKSLDKRAPVTKYGRLFFEVRP